MQQRAKHDIRTYRDLAAWQKGMQLAETVYRVTVAFPSEEKFGLVSQMRRAAVSIPSNIAEGFGRARNTEFRRFLEIARGSLFENADASGTCTAIGLAQRGKAGGPQRIDARVGRDPGRPGPFREGTGSPLKSSLASFYSVTQSPSYSVTLSSRLLDA